MSLSAVVDLGMDEAALDGVEGLGCNGEAR